MKNASVRLEVYFVLGMILAVLGTIIMIKVSPWGVAALFIGANCFGYSIANI